MMTRYKLAICELYTPYLHGYTDNSDKNIANHYMITNIITREEFYNDEYKDDIDIIKECYVLWLNSVYEDGINPLHPTIRSYSDIIQQRNYITLDIVETDELDGEEMVGYIKTFWLRIIQRKWKKIFERRKKIISERKLIKSLKYREINGKWNVKLRRI